MTSKETWVSLLLAWYQANKRDLPWRKGRNPYAIWISEIMLQQTRVETVVGYYQRFMQRFPTVEDLAQAETDEVLKLWEGLGYYSRARNLHRAARQMVDKGEGFPQTHQGLLALPGIGRYTAGALMSIAYNHPYPAVDGNVLRVMARLYLLDKDIGSQKVKNEIEGMVKSVFPPEASDFAQGLMELGALVCLPGVPRCGDCPLQWGCKAFQEEKQQELPVKKAKPAPQKVKRYVAVIQREDAVLMNKRPVKGMLGGLWEFPGVAVNSKKEFPHAFQLKYGLSAIPQEHLLDFRHVFTHRVWEMKVYRCRYDGEWPEGTGLQWFGPEDLEQIAIPGVFQPIKEELQRERKGPGNTRDLLS